ncbi:EcoKI restriction-modification system protein HsdS [uncultured Ruminococcus sp.]|nr:EcoKI restriction-modification system protein HsdS [uncultured Ruminococcus sp.]
MFCRSWGDCWMSKLVFLEDVCDILDSQRVPVTSKNRNKGIYPYYGANGVQDYVDDYIFDDELVLLAEDGGNFGSTEKPIAYRTSGKCWVNNHAHVLKAKECIDVDYLCYSLMFYNVSSIVNGATRQKLNQSMMRKMIIPLPEMNEQHIIVSKLDKVTNAIKLCNTILEKLDLLVKSQFVEMFGDIRISSIFPNISLDNFAQIGSSKRVHAADYVESGIPFYRSKEIIELGNGQEPSVELFISKKQYECIRKTNGVPCKGDILMSAVGTIGKMWIVDGQKDFYYKDGNIISIHSEETNPIYLKEALANLIDDFKSANVAGSAYSALTIVKLKKMTVPMPPISLQNEFADFVQQIDKSKLAVKKTLEKAETLKKTLMQEYFG